MSYLYEHIEKPKVPHDVTGPKWIRTEGYYRGKPTCAFCGRDVKRVR